MWNFKMTPEAHRIAIETLSKQGLLDLRLTRTGKDEFAVEGVKDDVAILSMGTVHVREGDTVTISGLKMELELNFDE